MKKLFFLLLLICGALASFGQSAQMSSAEYYIDIDPGVGHGTAITFSAADAVTDTFNIPTGTLTPGNHRMYVRYADVNGIWGNTNDILFDVIDTATLASVVAAQIAKAEYFVDTDPGLGNGTAITFSAVDSVIDTFTIATGLLSPGNHRLYVRYANTNGGWGNTNDILFDVIDTATLASVVAAQLAKAEYFVDTDPGLGNGTAITFSAVDSVIDTFTIATGTLTPGNHRLYVRYANTNGGWGNTNDIFFDVIDTATPASTLAAQITKVEYFVDTDPGAGNGTPITFSAVDSLTSSLSVSTTGLTPGYHRLYVRYGNTSGGWGNTNDILFYVIDPATAAGNANITQGEYFVDTDPGVGHGTALPSFATADNVLDTVSIATTGLATGGHTAFMRYRDSLGKWGQTIPAPFTVCASPPAAGAITGATFVCAGSTTPLSNPTGSGGIWSSSNTAIATVGTAGVVTGIAGGAATISYSVTNSCGTGFVTQAITVNTVGTPVTGPTTVCTGSTITLSNSSVGGVWSSGNTALAIVGSTGIVTGINPGPVVISYTSCGAATFTVTVNEAPVTITGTMMVCVGMHTTLNDGVTGGVWSSGATGIATIGAATGITGGVSAGQAVINYTTSCGTIAATVTVNSVAAIGFGSQTNPSACGASDGTITITGLTPTTSYTVHYSAGTSVSTTIISDASGNITITGLAAGSYSGISVSSGACSSNALAGPFVLSTTTIAINFGTQTNPSTCGASDGAIVITGLTPTTSYTVHYSAGTSVSTTIISDASGNITITGLAAGSYSGISVSSGACSSNALAGPFVLSTTTIAISFGTQTNPSTCGASDGTITITGLTPTTSYTVHYSAGTSVSTTIISDASGNITITGLAAGSYSGISVSSGACSSNVLGGPFVLSTTTIAIGFGSQTNPSTCGASDGAIAITGLTPTTSYMVHYLAGGSSASATIASDASGNITITGLAAGSYSSISVSSGVCSSNALAGPFVLSTTIISIGFGSQANPSACGASDGAIVITGLTPATSYTVHYSAGISSVSATILSDPSGNITITGLAAGSYSNISVSSVACSSNVLVGPFVLSTTPIAISFGTQTNPSACGASDGTITITGVTPTTSYTVHYSTGPSVSATIISDASGNITIGSLAGGSYSNISVSEGGCSSNVLAGPFVLSTTTITIGIGSVTSPSTCGASDGLITVAGLAPIAAYTVQYLASGSPVSIAITSDGTGAITIGGLPDGAYTNLTASIGGCSSNLLAGPYLLSNLLPTTLTGTAAICTGLTTVLSDGVSGGTWSSSNTGIAIVNSSGTVSGTGPGIATISHTVTNACGTATTTESVTVNTTPATGTITGLTEVAQGATIMLTDAAGGGTWSSASTATATIDISGNVAGMLGGTDTIYYTVTNSCGTARASFVVHVSFTGCNCH